jgi:hypothetical protein
MIVVLPVAEPDGSRGNTIPLRSALIAASVVLCVAVGMQVVPLIPLQRMWGAWSAAVANWQPLGGRSVLDLGYPMPPVADAAVIVPSRIRPVVATYRVNALDDGVVTRSSSFTVELAREGGGWRFRTDHSSRYVLNAQLSESLAPLAWNLFTVTGGASEFRREHFFTVRGDSLQYTYRHDPRDSIPRGGSGITAFDSMFPLVRASAAPQALDGAHFYTLLMGLDLRRGWVGSFYEMISPRYFRRFQSPPTTYMVVDEEMVTTPAGQFDSWRLSDLIPAPFRSGGIWVSKETGLVVKASTGDRWGSETELESVTYP